MKDWLEEWAIALCALLLIVIPGSFIAWAVISSNRAEDRFMAECEQDHKHYECMAMWRAGDRPSR